MASNDRTSPAVHAMEHICLDFRSRQGRYVDAFNRFLEENRRALGFEGIEDLHGAYLDRAFADNLPTTLIVSNITMGPQSLWLIRPSTEGPLAASFGAGHRAPAFRSYWRSGCLVVTGFEIVPHVPPRPSEIQISGLLHLTPTLETMTSRDLEVLEALPRRRQETAGKVGPWNDYMTWKEGLVKRGQVALRYDRIEVVGDDLVRFIICGRHPLTTLRKRLSRASLVVVPPGASRSPETWDPDPKARPGFIRVGDTARIEALNAGKRANGRDRNREAAAEEPVPVAITCRLNSGTEPEDIPAKGFVLSHIGGDLKPIHNERQAVKRLLNDWGHNPYLAEWLFDIGNAARPETIDDVISRYLHCRLNKAQRDAVNKAAAALDVFFILGPPGTGKTEAIAWICLLAIARGQRVLLSSQTNTAVDNVLARLEDQISVRPLRVAQEDRVEAETRQFLADNAPGVLLRKVVRDCRRRLREYQEQAQRIKVVEQALSSLRGILARIEENRQQIAKLEQQHEQLRQTRQEHINSLSSAQGQLRSLTQQRQTLAELVDWLGEGAGDPPVVEVLRPTPITQSLAACAGQLQVGLIDLRWPLAWLPAVAPSSADACLRLIHQARRVLGTIEELEAPVMEALAVCRGAADVNRSDSSVRVRELEAERARLLDSERDEDMLRVARINQELRALRGEQWSGVCRGLQRPLRQLFQVGLPAELEELISSLAPETAQVNVLQGLQVFAGQVRDQIRQVLQRYLAPLQDQCRAVISELVQRIEIEQQGTQAQQGHIDEIEYQIDEIQGQHEQTDTHLRELDQRWRELWPDTHLEQPPGDPPAPSAEALDGRRTAFEAYQQAHAEEHDRRHRWAPLLDQWVDRLARPEEARRPDLRALYEKHANVVGITCYEAGQRDFYNRPDFRPFDLVIIDEVSKVTPPELLEAALLGRKLILVGDHRQLPPHWKEQDFTFEEAAEDGQLDSAEVLRYRQMVTSSLFQQLYEKAPESLRQMLVIQYRMHPQIMAVINLFYDGLLVAGPDEQTLDRLRQHHLQIRDRRGGWFLEPHHHVLWIDSTTDARGRPFFERQSGTSKFNLLEVDLIEASLRRIDQGLTDLGYGVHHQLTASQAEQGLACRAWVERELPQAPAATIDDLLLHNRVTLNGRAARPGDIVRAGDALEIDARKQVGVITFYGAQLREIRSRIRQIREQDPRALSAIDLNTNTVDRFQGMECPIVLVSLVRARSNYHGGQHVKQYQRINVALSRAQELLVIIGSERTFRNVEIDLPPMSGGAPKKIPVYRRIYDLVTRFGGRRYAKQILA
ncbi:MAG: AAA family ATPase [Sedimentisphaerales bacterium]|nr:AAA family ATPase [Sedimentisphaerales bacterium]